MSQRRQSSQSSLSRYARPEEAELGDRMADFCNAFWGISDPGVEVLFARMRNSAKTIEELRTFWRERAAIEEEYARRLVKLGKQSLGTHEIGELRSSLEVLRQETERQAGQHLTLSIAIRKELEAPTTEFATKLANHRKTSQSAVERTFKVKQAQEGSVAKAKERYEQDCHRVNSYTAQQSLVQGRELEKVIFKLERAQSSVQANEREYATYTAALADTVARWDKEWKNFCDQCQDLEEERIEFMKDNVWAYANAVSTVCVSEDDSCEKIRLALEQLEVEKDIQFFVANYGTGGDIPEAPSFISYTNAEVSQPRPQSRRADFARSSTRPQNIMAPALAQPPPEEEPVDAGNAGVGAGLIPGHPPPGSISGHSRNNSRIGRNPINGGPETPSPNQPQSSQQQARTPSNYSNISGLQNSVTDYGAGTSPFASGSGANTVPLQRDNESPVAGGSGYGNYAATSSSSKDPQTIGGPNDPLAQQLQVLKTGASAGGSIRRTNTNSRNVESHKPPSSNFGSAGANKPTSPSPPSAALSPPLPAKGPVDYHQSAEDIVGAHPSTSRPTSPMAQSPPTAVMMQPSGFKSTSPLPVEQVLSQYGQALPEERHARRNSFNAQAQGHNSTPSQSEPRGRQDQRSPRPSTSGISPNRTGFAGIGAQGRSPSPSFARGQPSPSRATSPQPPRQSLANAAPRATSPIGIALDANGNVVQDSMAEAYRQPPLSQHPYATGGGPPPQPQQAPPQQAGMPGYGGARGAYYQPPGPPPSAQPPPAPMNNVYQTQPPQSYIGGTPHGGYNQIPMGGMVSPQPQPVYGGPPPVLNGGYGQQQQGGLARVSSVSYGSYNPPPNPAPMQAIPAPPAAQVQQPPQQVPQQLQQLQQPNVAGSNPARRSPSPAPQSQPPTRSWIDNQPILFYVKALYDYKASIDEEFDFQAGDVIAVTSTPEDGWWTGILLDDVRRQPGRNIFPSNFVCLF